VVFISNGAGDFSSPTADESFQLFLNTNPNAVSIVFSWFQDNVNTTRIDPDRYSTPTDDDLAHVVQEAKKQGLKTSLKPHVDCRDGEWRGFIGGNFNQSQWDAWFLSFREFALWGARFAQLHAIDLYVIGTELEVTFVTQTEQWISLIQAVREIYTGKVTISANHGDEAYISFWDRLDYIGVSAYYPLTDHADPTMQELYAAWKPYIDVLQQLSQTYNVPVMIPEIGYRSRNGTNEDPWDDPEKLDLEEQANCYQAVFDVFTQYPWFKGVFFWAWTTDPDQGGPTDLGFSPHGKPAEAVLTAEGERR